MALHPVFKMIVTRPELLAEHGGAYLALAAAEAGQAARSAGRLAGGLAAAAACLALGLGRAGVALLLLAVVPVAAMPVPWLLLLVPGVPLGAALWLWAAQRRHRLAGSFAALREQVALDRALLRQCSAP